MTLDRLSPSQMRILLVIALLLLTVIGGLGIALRGGSFDRPSVVYDNVPVAGVAPRAEEPDDFDLIFVDPDAAGTSLFSMVNRGKSDLEWQMVGVSRHPAGRVTACESLPVGRHNDRGWLGIYPAYGKSRQWR